MSYISREDAIKALEFERWGINLVLKSETLPYEARETLYQRRGQVSSDINIIKTLSAVDAVERKRGKWIDTGSGQECSLCNEIQYGYDNFRHFCPNCGANMREVK